MKMLAGVTLNLYFRELAMTAREIMRRNPRSIDREATVADAAEFLTARRIGAAPVIDDAGRPIGVVSRTDIVRHVRAGGMAAPDLEGRTVESIMNPTVYFALPNTSLKSVINKMLRRKINRLFVIDEHGVLIGVISALDVLRGLQRAAAEAEHVSAKPAPRLEFH